MGEVDRCYFQDLRMGSTGHGHVSATALCGWVSQGAKHNGTVTTMIVVSLVILSRMDFIAFSKSKSIEFEVVLKVNKDSNRIELELKNGDDSIRW